MSRIRVSGRTLGIAALEMWDKPVEKKDTMLTFKRLFSRSSIDFRATLPVSPPSYYSTSL